MFVAAQGELWHRVMLGGVRPKSLLLAVGGAAVIARTGIAGGQQAIAYAIFAVIATVGVAVPW